MRLTNGQAGFGALHIFLIIILFAVVGTVGLGVSRAQKKQEETRRATAADMAKIEEAAKTEIAAPAVPEIISAPDLNGAHASLEALNPEENLVDVTTLRTVGQGF